MELKLKMTIFVVAIANYVEEPTIHAPIQWPKLSMELEVPTNRATSFTLNLINPQTGPRPLLWT